MTSQKPLLQPVNESLDDQINDIWKKKMARLPIYKDLPRLAGRISITSTINKSIDYNPWMEKPKESNVSTQQKTTTASSADKDQEDEEDRKSLKLRLSCIEFDKIDPDQDKLEILDNDTNNEKIFKRLKKIVFKMAECFEKDNLQNVKHIFNNYETPTDFELHMSTLLKGSFDEENSKVIKILKLIHQNIIYVGCFEIKQRVPFLMANMTKDVRGPEGWRISIEETKDIVTVTHSRREESLPTQPKDKQFWFEWQLTIILNKDLSEITSTSLKIVQLQFCDTISQSFKNEVSRALCSGNLFIC